MLQKIKKKILFSIAAAGILYLGFTFYANIDKLAAVFETFNWFLIPLLSLLSLLNYFLRFLKWDYYLSIVKVKIKRIDSFFIFMSNLIMAVTPGKMGELLKSYLVKEISGTPVSKTFPIIFVERITDFVSLIFITLIGAYLYNFGREIILGVGIFFLLVCITLSNKKIALPFLQLLEKVKFLEKHLKSIHTAYESSYSMLQPLPLLYMTVLGIFSWSLECFAYYLILINFHLQVSFLWAAFSYGFAIIVGALSMLPGGLGITEGSLTFMLIRKNISKDIAVASTFIIRAVTLWFAVLVGIISVTIYQNRYGKITVETVQN
ncbi:MAG TPA: lysylphosphatidylglycerol synthase transmembrane domain-containing protein [Ignavibacteriaceae bacterium]|nr:lysylphosphatidylglycerol synthase transmembrane domain-containing protein [Ignavibacteriaceae bacterium]